MIHDDMVSPQQSEATKRYITTFLGDGMFLTGENAAKSLQQRHKHQAFSVPCCLGVEETATADIGSRNGSHDASMDRNVLLLTVLPMLG